MKIHLYVKEAPTGLKYFGMTKKQNPFYYKGSGDYWLDHLRFHKIGRKDIKTLAVYTFYEQKQASEFAINFSITNNIVESDVWANLKLEDARDGSRSDILLNEETIEKMKSTKRYQAENNLLWHQSDEGRKTIGKWASDRWKSLSIEEKQIESLARSKSMKTYHATADRTEVNSKIKNTLKNKNLSPWENYRISKNYESLRIWQQAEELYTRFKQGDISAERLAKNTNLPISKLSTIIRYFKNSWNPFNDQKFQEFKHQDLSLLIDRS